MAAINHNRLRGKMKKLIYLLTLFLALGIPAIAFGAKGAQNCGVGPKVVKGKGIASQSLVQYTNVTLLPSNAVSVTFGTSGCGYSNIVQKDAPRLQYIRFNYDNLAEDAARGEGIYISGLGQMMGCSKNAESVLTRTIHDNFGNFFKTEEGQIKGDLFFYSIKEEINKHPVLSKGCI